jgi:maleate isomerase
MWAALRAMGREAVGGGALLATHDHITTPGVA